jgi:hypothetical protein
MEQLKRRANNIIYGVSVSITPSVYEKDAYALVYSENKYREDLLLKLLRDTVPHFALTKKELEKLNKDNFQDLIRRAWNRISNRPADKKGDYGELILFLFLEVFYPAKKLITKVRLRSSLKEEIKGFDCSHFRIKGDDVEFWLGEAKFHKDFSGGISKAVSSINEHANYSKIKDELIIIEGNNDEIDEGDRLLIEKHLNADMPLEKINIVMPVLITYDSKAVNKYAMITNEFKDKLEKELKGHYSTIDKSKISIASNVKLLFILFPLNSVSQIKTELENIEKAHK